MTFKLITNKTIPFSPPSPCGNRHARLRPRAAALVGCPVRRMEILHATTPDRAAISHFGHSAIHGNEHSLRKDRSSQTSLLPKWEVLSRPGVPFPRPADPGRSCLAPPQLTAQLACASEAVRVKIKAGPVTVVAAPMCPFPHSTV